MRPLHQRKMSQSDVNPRTPRRQQVADSLWRRLHAGLGKPKEKEGKKPFVGDGAGERTSGQVTKFDDDE